MDWHFLYIDVAGTGLLPVEAERQGKIVITTELGGGGNVPAWLHRLAWDGLTNVLRHVGVLEGEVERRDPPGTILDGRDPRNYVFAPETGLWETFVDPGDEVRAGQPVGQIHFIERVDREPEVVLAPLAGVAVVVRAFGATDQGDSVFVSGQPIERDALI
jgi:N-alpha-acetyl-L-2,4-diaminobutyrate deacetylase